MMKINWPAKNVSGSIDGKTIGNPNHKYALASVTKLLTAHAVLIAVEEGVFDLDTPVHGLSDEGEFAISLGQTDNSLAPTPSSSRESAPTPSHAGESAPAPSPSRESAPAPSQAQGSAPTPSHSRESTPAQTSAREPAQGSAHEPTIAHLLAHASGVGFDSRVQEKQPGERRIYSSAGYEVLAEIIEKETEIPFPTYLDEAVCQPLGMGDTTLDGSAGHGAISTAHDMEIFVQEISNPTLLAKPHFEAWFPDLNGIVPGYGMFKPCLWGLGPEIKGEKGVEKEHWMGKELPASTVGHFGQSGTFLWAIPGGATCVMLTDRPFGDWCKPLWAQFNDDVARTIS